jgi:pyridoxine/pyridoxamine 5'-phosphate oxidase
MKKFDTLDEFLDQSWRLLLNAAVKRNHPMRTPVLGTVADNRAHLRTVILRQTNPQARTLSFYSDFRAAKIAHLQENAQLAALFYHPRKQWQIRVRGEATLHHQDEKARAHWAKISVKGRANYAARHTPGSTTDQPTDGLPDFWNSDLKPAETEFAYANFTLIEMAVFELEALLLHPEGHQRAHFAWGNDNWEKHWLIP